MFSSGDDTPGRKMNMEFSGNIQFADEGSWLTLTTESDETVTITVTLISPQATPEVLSFDVTPNSGVVRLPAGEILLALTGGGCRMVTGSFTATQGDSSCSKSFSVLPCRKFAYRAIEATIFTARPSKTPAYPGAEDRLYYFLVSGTPYAYVRFRYRSGGVSSAFTLSPTYSNSTRCYDIDASCDTMLSFAAAKGLTASAVTGYDIWIENGGEKSETYSFDIKRTLLPLKTYKFLGPRGTYEYIHATGAFSRSVESETRVFVTDGVERELNNDSSMTFEQNSGHIGSAGMEGFWLQLLASKERYIVEKDGSERLIIVDEHKASLSDRQVSSLTFKWHYANPNNTIVEKVDVALTGLTVTGPSSVNDASNEAGFSVTYSPSNTTRRGVSWSIVSGSDYASIDASGKLTVKRGAYGNTVTVRATSAADGSIYADKSVTVTYQAAAVSVTGVTLSRSVLSLQTGSSETLTATVAPERATDRSVVWSSSAPSVAEVDQTGRVTAKTEGSAVITVRTNDGGYTARCSVSVAAVVNNYTLTVECPTSGATVQVLEYVAGQSSWADAVTYTAPLTFRKDTTIKIRAYKNGMISSGAQTVLMDSDKTVTVACKAYPGWNLADTKDIEAAGGDITPVVSDPDSVGWRLVSEADWITVNSDGSGFTVAENTDTASRSGSVKLVCDAASTGETVASCSVTQAAAAVSEGHLLTINVSPSDASVSVNVNSAGSTKYTGPMRVEDGASVYVTAYKAGYVFKYETFTMNSDKTLDWTMSANPSWDLPTSLEIGQDGADDTGFSITDPDSVGWRIETPDWCNTDDGVTEGVGDHLSTLVFEPNDTGSDREGTVGLYTGASSTPVKSCKVTQVTAVEIIDMDVTREAVSGPEWQLVTSEMAAETAALANFVGWYKSMIEGTSNGETVTKLTFVVAEDCDIVIEFCSDAESNYDYLAAAAMDETQTLGKANVANLADVSTKGKQGISNKVRKTYTLSAGTHTLQIIYLKDSSVDKETDSGYYRILSEAQE